LRIHLNKGEVGLKSDSDIIVDQTRAIDNRRLREQLGEISDSNKHFLLNRLRLIILE
jgi:mRNA interferase MazF